MKILPQNTAYINQGGHNVGWFYDECWRCSIHLIWTVGPHEVSWYLEKEFGVQYQKDDPFDGRCIEILEVDAKGVAHVIALREWALEPRWFDALSHECFHATEQILDQRGIKHSEETSETYAYLQGSLVRRCSQILMQKPVRRRMVKKSKKRRSNGF